MVLPHSSPHRGVGAATLRGGQARCVAATTQHAIRGAWRPWITLGRAPHWCGLGLPAARAATRKKPKDETRTAIVTSSTFLASHPSAPGGSFAFGMMKCHASCTLLGRGSVRVTGQASVPVARCSTLFFFLIVSPMRIHRVLHVWPHRKVFCSHSRECVRVCVCARQSPLTCPEASFPNLHGTVIAKFKQWPRGPLHHTIPADKADRMGRVQRAEKSKFCLYCGSHQNAVRERKRIAGNQGNQDKPEGRPGGGLMNTPSRYPFAGLPANWKHRGFRV